ncbi:MAG: Gfo/Idh/MocA family oxidoreductase [Acidimicrobiales bacterium]|jgi:predicted dehydrogenase
MSDTRTGSAGTARIGIVGLGRMGRRHARVFSASGPAEVVWTVDPGGHALDGVQSFPTVSRALEAQVDGVIVAAPTVAHGEIAQQVIEAGVPCLVEKPLAATAAEAAVLVATANKRRVRLATGHVERFNPAVIATRELLASGRAGRPISLSFRRVGLPPAFAPDVDVLSDLAVHDLDVCAFLLGLDERDPIRVTGAIGWPGNALFESALILLDAAGIGTQIEVNWRTPTRIRRFSVTTDECLIEVDYTTQIVEIVQRTEELELEDFAGFASHYGSVLRTRLEVPTAEPLAGQAASFLAAVRGDPAALLASGVDGLRAIRLVEDARALALENNS